MRRALWLAWMLSVGLMVGCGHAEDFGGDRPSPTTQLGDGCTDDQDCDQYCALDAGLFPGGFCTLRNCRGNSDCPSGTVCIKLDRGVCVYPCSEPLDCTSDFLGRAGYTCVSESGYNGDGTTQVRYRVCLGR